MKTFDYIVLFITLIWFISENILDSLKLPKNKSKKLDQSSALIINTTSIISLLLGIGWGIYGRGTGIGWIKWGAAFIGYTGLFLLVFGWIIRWVAIFTLKSQFTVLVSIEENHQVIDRGIYRYLRHPSYAGGLLTLLGLGLALQNWISLLILVIPMFLALQYRIRVEEKVLIDHFGDQYLQYTKKTKRLIPKIY